jgi:hypothetical protein
VPPNSESRVHKEGSSMPHVHGTLHITYTVPLTSDRKEDRAATRPSPPLTGRPASAGRKRTSRGMHTTRRRASISASGQPRQDLGTEPRPCRLYHSCLFVSAAAATTVPSMAWTGSILNCICSSEAKPRKVSIGHGGFAGARRSSAGSP